MKHTDLIRELARRAGVPPAQAADRIDRVVHDILMDLKRGHPPHITDLGKLFPDGDVFRFDPTHHSERGASRRKRRAQK